MLIELKELLHNLRDRDWDVNPVYKIDENEGRKIISALESLEQKEILIDGGNAAGQTEDKVGEDDEQCNNYRDDLYHDNNHMC